MADRDVKVVYWYATKDGEMKLATGIADIKADGSMTTRGTRGEDDYAVGRSAGEYMTYAEYLKVSKMLYVKAVKMAKERLQKNGTER